MGLFGIKICGVTNERDALLAASAEADAIGLNFYAASPRFVADKQAAEIVASLPRKVARVGVFVNEPAAAILERYHQWGLDLVQLHGDETPAEVAALGEAKVLKAFRLGNDGFEPVLAFVEACRAAGKPLTGVLVDAQVAGSYGGTGQAVDWTLAAKLRGALGDVPLILAGGLHGGNVATAIAEVRPAGVDTASGVESAPGIKDARRVREFVAAAREALDSF